MTETQLKLIPLKKLELWEEANVRKSNVLENIHDLANNIKQNELRVPLLVKEKEHNKLYHVFSGQRRLESCRMINYSPVPCFVFKKISLREAQILSLSENLYREGMTIDDLSEAADTLLHSFKDISKVATALGVGESTVKGYLDYKAVYPEIRALVGKKGKGKISVQQAKDIYVKFPDKPRAIAAAKSLAKISDRTKKRKYHAAITESTKHDTWGTITQKAEKAIRMKPYNILLPDSKYKLIEKVAYTRKIDAEDLLITIVEKWIHEYEQGEHRT